MKTTNWLINGEKRVIKFCLSLVISLLFCFELSAQSDTLRGTLSFNFFGYPTLYQQDSLLKEKYITLLEQKRLSKKDSYWKELQVVYRHLKAQGKEFYPCLELWTGEAYNIIYLPVDVYHQMIVKSSEELTILQEKLHMVLLARKLHTHYFLLEKLEHFDWVKAENVRYGNKFSVHEYQW